MGNNVSNKSFLDVLSLTLFKLYKDYIRFAFSRKTDLRIFPVEVLGSLLKIIFLGTLNPANLERQNSITSFS